MIKSLLLTLLFLSQATFALEVDEKLTTRVIDVSESRKTILINRGVEDGLAVGDHAKFYVSVGVVSRGVVIKASPTRSVWSVYRLVNKEYIRKDQVLKLKITPAVKITKDESRMLVSDDSREVIAKDPRDLGIPLAEGADDLNKLETGKSNPMMNSMVDSSYMSLLNRNREIFGMFRYSSFTEETKPDVGDEAYTQDATELYIKVGGEWYFKTETEWYSRMSFLAHFGIDRRAAMAYQGAYVQEEGSEFGFGASLHPSVFPSRVHALIPYLNFTMSLGSVNSSYVSGKEQTVAQETSIDASVFSYSFGIGTKYYTTQGIGARFELSYLLRGEDYAADENNLSWVKTRSGPRFLFGLSYRL